MTYGTAHPYPMESSPDEGDPHLALNHATRATVAAVVTSAVTIATIRPAETMRCLPSGRGVCPEADRLQVSCTRTTRRLGTGGVTGRSGPRASRVSCRS